MVQNMSRTDSSQKDNTMPYKTLAALFLVALASPTLAGLNEVRAARDIQVIVAEDNLSPAKLPVTQEAVAKELAWNLEGYGFRVDPTARMQAIFTVTGYDAAVGQHCYAYKVEFATIEAGVTSRLTYDGKEVATGGQATYKKTHYEIPGFKCSKNEVVRREVIESLRSIFTERYISQLLVK